MRVSSLIFASQRSQPALAALQQILRQNRRTQFLETLQDKDTGAAALHAAVSDNHPLSTKLITVNEQRVQLQWLRYLLQQGANPQQGDNQGNTPLHILLAAGVQPHRRCSLEAISLLITPHPALVHALNHFQEYPLHTAVQAGWVEAVQCLLQYPL
jgi:ankyrin repeat protein